MDRSERRRCGAGRQRHRQRPPRELHVYLTAGCEINFANPGRRLARSRSTPTASTRGTYNVEHGLEIQHEPMPRLSVAGQLLSRLIQSARRRPINRALQFDGDPAKNPALHTPFTIYDPRDGTPITGIRAQRQRDGIVPPRPTTSRRKIRNRGSQHNARSTSSLKARPGGGAQVCSVVCPSSGSS